MDLNKYVLEKAIENNICEDWAIHVANAKGKHELLKMYVKGIDFALSTNFIPKHDLKNLAGDIINDYGIYVDQNIKLNNDKFIVLLGDCNARLAINAFSVTQLFTKDNSSAIITVSDNAFLVIDAFDNSKIEIETNDNANVLLNLYGNASVIQFGQGNLKIIHKKKLTY